MKRSKQKIKKEDIEPTTSRAFNEEHDLAYYIHDRVELMHQVFSVLKYKDLKSIAPECVRRLSIDDLQELCLEELLGISSKRLCAILDGAEPPSDTESSSQSEHFETISLDSISSDEEILSETSKKSKKKHRHRRNSKHKRKKSKDRKNGTDEDQSDQENDKSRASRAGLTVLELLELQARARAIRAQLQQEQINKPTIEVSTVSNHHPSDDDEVEIKEEPAEVFEISSEDEKPKIEELQTQKPKTPTKDASQSKSKGNDDALKENDKASEKNSSNPETITKRTNDLIVTVTKQPTRKIKLNRNKFPTPSPNVKDFSITCDNTTRTVKISGQTNADPENNKSSKTTSDTSHQTTTKSDKNNSSEKQKTKDKNKRKQKKKAKTKGNDASDDDEITLQLSDSEKMDLLENFDRKDYDGVSSSSSQDSESSSDSDDQESKEIENKQDVNKIAIKEPEPMITEDKIETVKVANLVETSAANKNDYGNDSNKVDIITDIKKTAANKNDYGNDSNKVDIITDIEETAANKNDYGNDSNKVDIITDIEETAANKNDHGNDSNKVDIITDIEEKVNLKDILVKNSEEDQDVGMQNESNSNNPIPVIIDNENLQVPNNEEFLLRKINENNLEINTIETEEPHKIMSSEIENVKSPDQPKSNKMLQKIMKTDLSVLELDNSNEKLKESVESCKVTHTDVSVEQSSEITENPENSSVIIVSEEVIGNMCNASASKEVRHDDKLNTEKAKNSEQKSISEGEITDQDSSEVETIDLQPEVVCISDDESSKKGIKIKKNKKKEKKSKKAKKSKKNKVDFQKGDNQNFYRDLQTIDVIKITDCGINYDQKLVNIDDYDDVYEILELSDDSSCYEVEGVSVSKEPTAEEIATLSAKIDEIEREDVITDEQIRDYENKQAENQDSAELENISWKDRYLGSKKVKTVLTTANILNAMRKKNKELKKRLEESKKSAELVVEKNIEKEHNLEEGTIEHYNTLEGSTKYVHPVPDPATLIAKDKTETAKLNESEKTEEDIQVENENNLTNDTQVTKEMKNDAKQLLKMYKRLLKYNDMNKQKDPNKKKKKKTKKKEDKKKSDEVT